MAYAEQNISVYGDEKAFFDALETFLTTNTVAQFTKTAAYDTTTRSISFAINGLTLNFTGLGNNLTSSKRVRINVNSGRTGAVTNTIDFASVDVGSGAIVTNRTLNLLLIRKGGDVVLNIGSRTNVIGKGITALAVIPNENNYYIYGTSGNGTSWTFIKSDTQAVYTLSPYHTYQKATGQLFLDPELPILNSANGEFLFSTTGIVGLGGAEARYFYTGINGDRYYAIMSNVAIKMNA